LKLTNPAEIYFCPAGSNCQVAETANPAWKKYTGEIPRLYLGLEISHMKKDREVSSSQVWCTEEEEI